MFIAYLVAILPAKLPSERIRPAGLTVWILAVIVGLVIWGFNNGGVPTLVLRDCRNDRLRHFWFSAGERCFKVTMR
ncbi:DUF3054 domain-containing protein [Streptomyces sp. NA13]|uniref:DUF3054 domain-containing protein n=1 Tax=Streptomyces sp. NA13 TaxID=2996051 RepID=UPI00226E74B6|nr:DUF3054 domain-containing protein [Streptomyces sp. NA13]WAD00572.1 DUF3054 domain-containing protein [Streptomyces sp. NA13]